jgi:hypothetical protein
VLATPTTRGRQQDSQLVGAGSVVAYCLLGRKHSRRAWCGPIEEANRTGDTGKLESDNHDHFENPGNKLMTALGAGLARAGTSSRS